MPPRSRDADTETLDRIDDVTAEEWIEREYELHLSKALENATKLADKKRAAPERESQCGPSHFTDPGCATKPNQPDR